MRRTIPPSSADGLAQRLRRMEQEIADLQSVRGTPPSYVEPEDVVAGGITEAFSADAVGTTVTNVASSATGSPKFRVSSTSIGRFRTTGVSDMSSAVTQVTVPAGLWEFQALVQLSPDTTAPSSGYCDVMFDLVSEWVRVPWSQIVDPGVGDQMASAWLARRYYFASATAIGVSVDNLTDVSIEVRCVMVSGVQLAEYGTLTLA